MKKISISLSFCLASFLSFSQQTNFYKDPQNKFNEAKEYFQKEQYNLAYPIFKELQQAVKETNRVNNPIVAQEIDYYTIVSGLKQNEGRAEGDAQDYIAITKNNPRVEMMNFHLAEYYFRM